MQTLRLLGKMSPELLDAAYRNHLDSLATSSNLALPLKIPEALDTASKLRLGRLETAGRALEVAKAKAATMVNDSEAGKELAHDISGICDVMDGLDSETAVWESGLKFAVDELTNGECTRS